MQHLARVDTRSVRGTKGMDQSRRLRSAALAFPIVLLTLGTTATLGQSEAGGSPPSAVSCQIIRGEEIANAPTVSQGLRGRVTGMLFAPTSSQAGGGSRLSLRGNSSLQRVPPLVFIDDIRITESPVVSALDQMPPQDVLLIEVFRGPAATTLWGTGASGGVIRVYSRHGHPRSDIVGDSKAWCVP